MGSWVEALLERPIVYRLWQAPFARAKLAPVFAHNDLSAVRRVLDLGCGPGTNAAYFTHCDYLGIDLNARYIESARRRHGGEFIVADVRTLSLDERGRYDFVLINSLLHHIDDENVLEILSSARDGLTAGGGVHILDLVLPERPSVSRLLARRDRGSFPRTLVRWQELFSAVFQPVVCEPYPLGVAGVTLWSMVYFKGRRWE